MRFLLLRVCSLRSLSGCVCHLLVLKHRSPWLPGHLWELWGDRPPCGSFLGCFLTCPRAQTLDHSTRSTPPTPSSPLSVRENHYLSWDIHVLLESAGEGIKVMDFSFWFWRLPPCLFCPIPTQFISQLEVYADVSPSPDFPRSCAWLLL